MLALFIGSSAPIYILKQPLLPPGSISIQPDFKRNYQCWKRIPVLIHHELPFRSSSVSIPQLPNRVIRHHRPAHLSREVGWQNASHHQSPPTPAWPVPTSSGAIRQGALRLRLTPRKPIWSRWYVRQSYLLHYKSGCCSKVSSPHCLMCAFDWWNTAQNC